MGFSAPVENLTPKSPPLSYKYLSQRGIFWQHLGEVPRKGFPKNAPPRGPAYLAGGGTPSAAVPTTRKIAHESMSCDCNPRNPNANNNANANANANMLMYAYANAYAYATADADANFRLSFAADVVLTMYAF